MCVCVCVCVGFGVCVWCGVCVWWVCVYVCVCVGGGVVRLCISYHWCELSYYNQFYRLPFSSIGECRAFVSSLALCSLRVFPHILSSLLALMCFFLNLFLRLVLFGSKSREIEVRSEIFNR